jgi:transcriptional regulator with XRE-family HTH domain
VLAEIKLHGYACAMNRIRELRLEHARQHPPAFTAAALAHRLGIDSSTLRRWERGVTRPTQRHARWLAREFGVSVAELQLEDGAPEDDGAGQAADHDEEQETR